MNGSEVLFKLLLGGSLGSLVDLSLEHEQTGVELLNVLTLDVIGKHCYEFGLFLVTGNSSLVALFREPLDQDVSSGVFPDTSLEVFGESDSMDSVELSEELFVSDSLLERSVKHHP